jgi:hypothetical protein
MAVQAVGSGLTIGCVQRGFAGRGRTGPTRPTRREVGYVGAHCQILGRRSRPRHRGIRRDAGGHPGTCSRHHTARRFKREQRVLGGSQRDSVDRRGEWAWHKDSAIAGPVRCPQPAADGTPAGGASSIGRSRQPAMESPSIIHI